MAFGSDGREAARETGKLAADQGDDEAARSEHDPDILEERPESVLTGREIKDLAGEEPGWSSKTGRIRKKAAPRQRPRREKRSAKPLPTFPIRQDQGCQAAPLPDFVEPALATLVSSAPAGERWLHEIKFDGYRLQARIEAGRVRLLTRGGSTGRRNSERRWSRHYRHCQSQRCCSTVRLSSKPVPARQTSQPCKRT